MDMSFYPHTGRIPEGYRKDTGRVTRFPLKNPGNFRYAPVNGIHGALDGDPQNSINWPGAWKPLKPEADRKVLGPLRPFEGPGPIWGSMPGALPAALMPGPEPC